MQSNVNPLGTEGSIKKRKTQKTLRKRQSRDEACRLPAIAVCLDCSDDWLCSINNLPAAAYFRNCQHSIHVTKHDIFTRSRRLAPYLTLEHLPTTVKREGHVQISGLVNGSIANKLTD